MAAYRPKKGKKEADTLAKKAARNILSERFTPEQLLTIQPMLDRLDQLEKAVKGYKKGLAEVKGQYNKLFAAYRLGQMGMVERVQGKGKGRKPGRGASSPVVGDNKGEE